MNLWRELKRRNVFRVAAAYAVVSWLLMEIADTVFPALMLPEWSVTLVIALLLLGFPVALVMSWAFELTPEGVKRAGDVDPSQSITPMTGRRLDFLIIGVLVLALSWFVWDKFFAVSTPRAASIAVLPFTDMSPLGDQEYFSDGLAEEILNLLAQIDELKVIARTSSFAFKGRNVDLREIGDVLGAAYVLEGSVRKADDQLRITAQLIDTNDGAHLWSNSFDRRLKNVFEIQDEIADAIVEALEVSLAGKKSQAANKHETDSMPAYELFLQARRLIQSRRRSSLVAARGLLDEAMELDPDYAPALAAAAQTILMLSDEFGSYGRTPLAEAVAEAEPLIERALAEGPGLAEAHAVQGLKFLQLRQFSRATRALKQALELNPSHSDALNWHASGLAQHGRLDEGISAMQRAVNVDPLNLPSRANLAFFYQLAGREEEAIDVAARLQREHPEYVFGFLREAEIWLSSGQLAKAVPAAEHALRMSPDNYYIEYRAEMLFRALGVPARILELSTVSHGRALIALQRPEEAVAEARAKPDTAPDEWSRPEALLATLSLTARHDEVRALYAERWGSPDAVAETFGADVETREMIPIATALRAVDEREELAVVLDHWGQRIDFLREHGYAVSWLVAAQATHAALSGDHSAALEHLARAIDRGYRDPLLARDPAFSELRDDPGFQAQVERMVELINAEREKLGMEPLLAPLADMLNHR